MERAILEALVVTGDVDDALDSLMRLESRIASRLESQNIAEHDVTVEMYVPQLDQKMATRMVALYERQLPLMPLANLQEICCNNAGIFVRTVDGQLIAAMHYEVLRRAVEIKLLAVRTQDQIMGLGSGLVKRLSSLYVDLPLVVTSAPECIGFFASLKFEQGVPTRLLTGPPTTTGVPMHRRGVGSRGGRGRGGRGRGGRGRGGRGGGGRGRGGRRNRNNNGGNNGGNNFNRGRGRGRGGNSGGNSQ